MMYRVTHQTVYTYNSPVDSSFGQLHQLPINTAGQRCLESSVEVSPTPSQMREREDYFGNRVMFYSIDFSHTVLQVTATSTVDTKNRCNNFSVVGLPGNAGGLTTWEHCRDLLLSPNVVADRQSVQFRLGSPRIDLSDAVRDFASDLFVPGAGIEQVARGLASRIYNDFEFSPDATDVSTPVDEILKKRAGVCQDFTHLMIAVLRRYGLAARYVSGYLETRPPPGQQKLVGADQSHAWVDLYLGNGVWVGLDPTNDQVAGSQYVTTAYGRDYADIAPLKGIVYTDATMTEMEVSVDVNPLSPHLEG